MNEIELHCLECNKSLEIFKVVCSDKTDILTNHSNGHLSQVTFMKEAYGMLYELENITRIIIDKTMIKNYGIDWFIKAPLTKRYQSYRKQFSKFYLHELISLINSYDCLSILFTSKEIFLIRNTLPIRNKIAHSKLISDYDFEQLSIALKIIKKSLSH